MSACQKLLYRYGCSSKAMNRANGTNDAFNPLTIAFGLLTGNEN